MLDVVGFDTATSGVIACRAATQRIVSVTTLCQFSVLRRLRGRQVRPSTHGRQLA
jgi:hypothetical protein